MTGRVVTLPLAPVGPPLPVSAGWTA